MENKEKLLLTPNFFKPSFHGRVVEGALNPAAIRLPNKKILLYVRVAESYLNKKSKISKEKDPNLGANIAQFEKGIYRLETISHFRKVILSEDGFTVEKIYQNQEFSGKEKSKNKLPFAVEDPRIVKIGKKYLMTYVSVFEKEGICTSLATSKNLKKWKRLGIIFREQNKDAFLFPKKINRKYVALHRPEGFLGLNKPSIWISYSPDLIHWGQEKVIMQPRENSWEDKRIGGGAPPIKTKKGWLLIYHGVKNNEKGQVYYSAGAALLDLKDPSKVIARSPKDKPLFLPNKDYEREGFTKNVIFPTGVVPTLDRKNLLVFSGGADSTISVRKISFKEIFSHMVPGKD